MRMSRAHLLNRGATSSTANAARLIGALERDDAFLHVAEGVERNIRIGKRLRLRGKKTEIRLEDARSPPADGGQAAGVEIQLALASEGQHVAGLEEIKLRLERGGMEDFRHGPCQRKGGAWPEPLGKIQEKITVRRYGHPGSATCLQADRRAGAARSSRAWHG